MSQFKDKTIWITGASSGIGEELARQLSKEGAFVILSARRAAELERVKASLDTHMSAVLPLDMSQPDTFDEALNAALRYTGKIDYLVHSAGISQRSKSIDTQPEVDRRIMEVNYFGPVLLSKLLLPYYVAQGNGHFVVISSVVGKLGTPLRSSYAASKHALHGYFDSLRAEHWRDNIKVTIICPGYVRTAISLHALTSNGTPHARMDENQEKGISPYQCALGILKALEKGKEEVYVGGKEITGIYLKRFFPRMLSGIIKRIKIK
jgi:dehydrogenase/reductase SDR family member 7B